MTASFLPPPSLSQLPCHGKSNYLPPPFSLSALFLLERSFLDPSFLSAHFIMEPNGINHAPLSRMLTPMHKLKKRKKKVSIYFFLFLPTSISHLKHHTSLKKKELRLVLIGMAISMPNSIRMKMR